jgi:methionine synthase II (cobalamin-independent)
MKQPKFHFYPKSKDHPTYYDIIADQIQFIQYNDPLLKEKCEHNEPWTLCQFLMGQYEKWIRELIQEKNKLAQQNYKLKIHLNRLRYHRPNWLKHRKNDLDIERMQEFRENWRNGFEEYAIWMRDIIPLKDWLFEVN